MNADEKIWNVKFHVETGFVGTVILQVQQAGSEEWINTGHTAEVNVASSPATMPVEEPETAVENTPEAEEPGEIATDQENQAEKIERFIDQIELPTNVRPILIKVKDPAEGGRDDVGKGDHRLHHHVRGNHRRQPA